MSKLLTAALLISLWTGAAAAGDVTVVTLRRTVDLDAPGALQALQLSNPTHFNIVLQVMSGVAQQPDAQVPGWMRATFNTQGVHYAPIAMTSFPPKRRLSFVLDDSRYTIVVILARDGKITPLR
jgi:hypothetical protein